MSSNEKEKQVKEKKSQRKFIFYVVLFFAILGVFFSLKFFSRGKKREVLSNKLENIIFKRIYFDKFIVVENRYPDSQSKLFKKIWIAYMKGYVDVEFPFKNFKLQGNNLVYFSNKKIDGEFSPFYLEINVPSENFYNVYEIKPQPISENTAENISTGVSIAVGGTIGYFGAKTGILAGKTLCTVIPSANKFANVCGLVGGAIGGLGSGAIAYKVSKGKIKAFLGTLHFTDKISAQDKERLFEEAKKLIVIDMFNNEGLRKELTQAFESYIRNYYAQYGIKINRIIYKTQPENTSI